MGRCDDVHGDDSAFDYCPSTTFAILFSALFSLTTILHVFQAFYYKKAFCWVVIMASSWEAVGYILRIFNTKDITSEGFGFPSQLLILLAPLWVNAFCYMLLGRLVHAFLPDGRVGGIKARRLAMLFVCLDIVAFLVQGGGGTLTNSDDAKTKLLGIHIYMGGIGLQEFFIIIFIILAARFQIKIQRIENLRNGFDHGGVGGVVGNNPPSMSTAAERRFLEMENGEFEDEGQLLGTPPLKKGWKRLLYTMYGSLIFITIRIIYRLVEYSGGVDDYMATHEVFFFVLESVPMFLCLGLYNLFHPGSVLIGKSSEFPKKVKKTKEEKKREKEEKKEKKMREKKGVKIGERETVGTLGDQLQEESVSLMPLNPNSQQQQSSQHLELEADNSFSSAQAIAASSTSLSETYHQIPRHSNSEDDPSVGALTRQQQHSWAPAYTNNCHSYPDSYHDSNTTIPEISH